MHTFDLVVLGAGGGIDETDLSAYLLKPADRNWNHGMVALEAGSGQGALRRILGRNPSLFNNNCSPAEIYSWIQSFVLSHPHLDHINSLVISAGASSGPRKRIYAAKQVLEVLKTHIFQGLVWPDLASYKEHDDSHKYFLKELQVGNRYRAVHRDISIQMHPVSHGCAGSKEYQSSAFFVRHDPTGKEFLFFGDVEPDSLSSNPQNIHVWNIAAPKFPTELSTIFIECSYTCERKDSELYGHLSPKHLVDELVAFAEEVYKYRTPTSSSSTRRTSKKQKVAVDPRALRGILIGLRVVIIHCKDDMRSRVPPRQTILEQVRALVYSKGLGAEIIAAEQGMHLTI